MNYLISDNPIFSYLFVPHIYQVTNVHWNVLPAQGILFAHTVTICTPSPESAVLYFSRQLHADFEIADSLKRDAGRSLFAYTSLEKH